MAHTLKLYDGVEGTTLDLAAVAATGYHLMRYPFATAPELEVRATSSQFADGELPYYDRKSNITEDITIEIVGSSADDLWIKVRALQRALENARDYYKAPLIRTPTYLEFKPSGSTNSGYSTVTGGQLILPDLYAAMEDDSQTEPDLLSYTIIGAVLRVEREPFWRAFAPAVSSTETDYKTGEIGVTGTYTVDNTFEQIDITKSVTGDIPALVRIKITPSAPPADLDEVWIGVSSSRRHGTTNYSNCAPWSKAENQGADAAINSDATAIYNCDDGTTTSPGPLRTTFATTAASTKRADYGATTIKRGAYRLFIRAKVATGTATVYLKCYRRGTAVDLPSVSVTATSWRWHEMGMVDTVVHPASNTVTSNADATLSQIDLYAAGVSGVNLDVDGIYFIPCDEGFIYAKPATAIGTSSYVYDNIMPVPTGHSVSSADGQYGQPANGRGSIRLNNGKTLMTIMMQSAGVTDKSWDYVLKVYSVSLYSAPRGNG